MANDAKAFSARLNRYSKELNKGVAKATGEYGAAYFNKLLEPSVTPVLTGYARSRWRLKLGSNQVPELSAPPPRNPSSTYASPRPKKLDLVTIQSIAISNNAPYIRVLNASRFILGNANAGTEGLLDRLLKRYAPK